MDMRNLAFPKGRTRLTGEPLALLRLECMQRDGGRCRECFMRVSDSLPDWHPLKYHMAHVISRGAGGEDVIDNVLCLCGGCHRDQHQGKKLRCIEEAKAILRRRDDGAASGVLQDPLPAGSDADTGQEMAS